MPANAEYCPQLITESKREQGVAVASATSRQPIGGAMEAGHGSGATSQVSKKVDVFDQELPLPEGVAVHAFKVLRKHGSAGE
ncbi:MAG: hypothetical protein J2P28_16660 [Actinobacteria bacterium]|nr:hypothetical protein [Actinomycetota bacterium]